MAKMAAERQRDCRARRVQRGEMRVHVYLPRVVHRALKQSAEREGVTLGEWMAQLLKAAAGVA